MTYERLTSGRLLARNTSLNLAGWIVPAVLALVSIPVLTDRMGIVRFGVFALVWTAVGYFNLFDLGISRALTQRLAERTGRDSDVDAGNVAVTALHLVLPLGVGGGIVLAALAPWLAIRVFSIPVALQAEVVTTFYLLAFAVPWMVGTAALRGILESFQRFGTINALRIPLAAIIFLGPLITTAFTPSLVPAVAVIASGRAILWGLHLVASVRAMPSLRTGRFTKAHVPSLIRFGSWMTVSGIISPIMDSVDRFAIGAAISVSAVAYYATPHELATKMWFVTAALLPVMFPALAASFVRDTERTRVLFDRTVRVLFAVLFLPTLLLVAFAREGLGLWLGPSFALESSRVLQILVVAIFINTAAQAGLSFLQAAGRPDLSGRLHAVELPLYLVALWVAMRWGVVGVAAVWGARATVDCVGMLILSRRVLPALAPSVTATFGRLFVAVAIFAMVGVMASPSARLLAAGVTGILFLGYLWYRLLSADERALIASAGARLSAVRS